MNQLDELKLKMADNKSEQKICVLMMREATDNATWDKWCNRKYELVKESRVIGAEMSKIVKANMKARRA